MLFCASSLLIVVEKNIQNLCSNVLIVLKYTPAEVKVLNLKYSVNKMKAVL